MSSKEDILARLKKHAIDPVERPGMEFTPITYADPLAQFEKILKAVGANFVSERVPECQVDRFEPAGDHVCHGESRQSG